MSTTLMAEIAGVPPVVLSGLSGLQEQVGSGDRRQRLADLVLQEDIQTFATLTGDQQWIHVER